MLAAVAVPLLSQGSAGSAAIGMVVLEIIAQQGQDFGPQARCMQHHIVALSKLVVASCIDIRQLFSEDWS